jgi:hypothetical protein
MTGAGAGAVADVLPLWRGAALSGTLACAESPIDHLLATLPGLACTLDDAVQIALFYSPPFAPLADIASTAAASATSPAAAAALRALGLPDADAEDDGFGHADVVLPPLLLRPVVAGETAESTVAVGELGLATRLHVTQAGARPVGAFPPPLLFPLVGERDSLTYNMLPSHIGVEDQCSMVRVMGRLSALREREIDNAPPHRLYHCRPIDSLGEAGKGCALCP